MAHPDECLEDDRFKKLEKSHTDTAEELKKINLTLMRIETTLSGKVVTYDKHVDDGDRFRSSIMFWLITSICGGLVTAGGFGIWVGGLSKQLEMNTKKWELFDSKMGVLIGQPRMESRVSENQSSR